MIVPQRGNDGYFLAASGCSVTGNVVECIDTKTLDVGVSRIGHWDFLVPFIFCDSSYSSHLLLLKE